MLRLKGFAFCLRTALRILASAAANVNFAGDTFAVVAVIFAVGDVALDSVDSFFIHSNIIPIKYFGRHYAIIVVQMRSQIFRQAKPKTQSNTLCIAAAFGRAWRKNCKQMRGKGVSR